MKMVMAVVPRDEARRVIEALVAAKNTVLAWLRTRDG